VIIILHDDILLKFLLKGDKIIILYRESNRYGIPEKTIATIKKMYTNINIKISIEDAEFIFNSISGVKQSDNLAPVLFLLIHIRQMLILVTQSKHKHVGYLLKIVLLRGDHGLLSS
jgi:hypothetical protein